MTGGILHINFSERWKLTNSLRFLLVLSLRRTISLFSYGRQCLSQRLQRSIDFRRCVFLVWKLFHHRLNLTDYHLQVGAIDDLVITESPVSDPGPNEVLVKVHAVSLNVRIPPYYSDHSYN